MPLAEFFLLGPVGSLARTGFSPFDGLDNCSPPGEEPMLWIFAAHS
jgi:hypothetical protein